MGGGEFARDRGCVMVPLLLAPVMGVKKVDLDGEELDESCA